MSLKAKINLTPPKKLLSLLAGFMLGVFIASYYFPLILAEGVNWPVFLVISSFSLLFYLVFYKTSYRFVFLILLSLFLGFSYYQFNLPVKDKGHISFYWNKEVELTGWISQEPVKELNHSQFVVSPLKIKYEGEIHSNVKGKLLLFADSLKDLKCGQKIQLKTKLKKPKSNEGSGYERYLSAQNIYSLGYLNQYEKMGVVDKAELGLGWYYFNLKRNLLSLKQLFLNSSRQVIKLPYSSLLAGLLFGSKMGLGESLEEAFIKTGLIHIVVVSGYNISILIKYFARLTKKWLARYSFLLGSLAIVLFVMMVGGSAPAVRAGIMAWIILLAQREGRQINELILLMLSAFLMVLANSKVLVFDLGFQLSFLAVVGLIYFSPIIEGFLKKLELNKYLPNVLFLVLIETLSAQLLTFPLILYQFGRVSLIAPLANLLVLPLIPVTMGLGFLASLISLMSTSLGQLVGWFVEGFLRYIVEITQALAQLSFSQIELKWFNIYLLIVSYSLITCIYVRKRSSKKIKENLS